MKMQSKEREKSDEGQKMWFIFHIQLICQSLWGQLYQELVLYKKRWEVCQFHGAGLLQLWLVNIFLAWQSFGGSTRRVLDADTSMHCFISSCIYLWVTCYKWFFCKSEQTRHFEIQSLDIPAMPKLWQIHVSSFVFISSCYYFCGTFAMSYLCCKTRMSRELGEPSRKHRPENKWKHVKNTLNEL